MSQPTDWTLPGFGNSGTCSDRSLGKVSRSFCRPTCSGRLICDRVAILNHGRLREVGEVGQTRAVAGHFSLSVRSEDVDRAVALLSAYQVTVEGPGKLVVEAGSGGDLNRILAAGGVYAEAIMPLRSELEERFLALTEG
jgi:ABC-2 type transport system ATP-binding protein